MSVAAGIFNVGWQAGKGLAGSIGWCHDRVVAEATLTGGLMGHNQGQVAMGFNTVLFGQGYGSNGCLVGGTPIGYAVEQPEQGLAFMAIGERFMGAIAQQTPGQGLVI